LFSLLGGYLDLVLSLEGYLARDFHPSYRISSFIIPFNAWFDVVMFDEVIIAASSCVPEDLENPNSCKILTDTPNRHFWCGQCQDFTFASLAKLDPVSIAKSGINVVIISNGSWKIIKKYKEIFECPFPIYVDGPRKLYSLMG